MTNRIEILQALIDKNKYTRYLELGVRDGECFDRIVCEYKIGVDPDRSSKATHHLTSDEFFKIHIEAVSEQPVTFKRGYNFDIIFIDGLHHADQVEKDIINSLAVLNEGGIIVMHDCLPTSKRMQEIPLTDQNEWTGNTWLAYLKMRVTRPDLEMRVCSTDWGLGLIRKGSQVPLSLDYIPTYEQFDANRNEWMNVIDVEQFKTMYL